MAGKRKQQTIAAQQAKPPAKAAGNNHSVSLKWAPLGILLFTALIYSCALQNGLTSFDDDFYIIKNPYLRDFSRHGIAAIFSSFYQSNYHPLTTLTYLFEFHLFGLNPMPYHLVNVLLHLLNTWLVFKCIEKLSGSKLAATIVSLLFAIHPMHVESVAWISERKDVLYAAFYLAAIYTYLQYIRGGHRMGEYLFTLILFILSLLSKAAAVTLPLLLIAIDVYSGRGISKKTLADKIPLLLLSLIFGIINIFAQKAGGPVEVLLVRYGVINGIFLFCSGIALYLIRAIVPFQLSAMHYFPNPADNLPLPYYLSLPFLALIVWGLFRLKKDNPMRKELFFGGAFFLIAISVMLQLISVGSALTAERYTYIAYLGLFYIVGIWMAHVLAGTQQRTVIIGIFSAIIAIYSYQTWNRIGVWKDDETLLTDVIDKNPGIIDVNYIYLLRGNERMNSKDFKGAAEDFMQSLSMAQQFTFAGTAYFGLGHAHESMGDINAAMADYNNAIAQSPKMAECYNSRGWLYYTAGNKATALQDYNTAIALQPDFAEAYNNRGWWYQNNGNAAAAMQDYNKALSLAPNFEKPRFNRAALNANQGNLPAAADDYTYLINEHPTDNSAYFYRGLARMNMKNSAGACEDWKRSADLGNQKAAAMLQQYCR